MIDYNDNSKADYLKLASVIGGMSEYQCSLMLHSLIGYYGREMPQWVLDKAIEISKRPRTAMAKR